MGNSTPSQPTPSRVAACPSSADPSQASGSTLFRASLDAPDTSLCNVACWLNGSWCGLSSSPCGCCSAAGSRGGRQTARQQEQQPIAHVWVTSYMDTKSKSSIPTSYYNIMCGGGQGISRPIDAAPLPPLLALVLQLHSKQTACDEPHVLGQREARGRRWERDQPWGPAQPLPGAPTAAAPPQRGGGGGVRGGRLAGVWAAGGARGRGGRAAAARLLLPTCAGPVSCGRGE